MERLMRPSRFSKVQIIALSFLGIIVAGTLLLLLPFATREGESTTLLDAAFTAVSATCVTGLIVHDTFRHWTLFGQLVILVMIQLGGLGLMAFSVTFSLLLRRRIGLKERGILQESVNTLQIGGIVKLVRQMLLGTLLFEGLGALLLSIRFIGDFGVGKGLYYGIFHSISAFCNGGFDLMGVREAGSSMTYYAGDPLVNLTLIALIMIGGTGFLVWDDLLKNKWHFRRYRLHTKLVLSMSAILLFGGALLFYLLERGGILAGEPVGKQILLSLFQSATTRTAGFNTAKTEALGDSSKLWMAMLMFVGGNPGSTAGGIKTTTLAVLLIYLRSTLRRTKGAEMFGRRLEEEVVKRAAAILTLSLMLDLFGTLALTALEQLPLADVLFEVVSALGTVGISVGITGGLSAVSKLILMFLMYCGRMGSLTFALIFTENRQTSPAQKPTERISVG
ncbi:MAG: Trk family potassium uptake protein [Lachnospiraceae bacterium]|nr:Trk family potassium uptake protein [Lachnospiraceae bacterium]MCI9622676.1 Trk family potassium uptake protein [Lachnospiraceae bacterium]